MKTLLLLIFILVTLNVYGQDYMLVRYGNKYSHKGKEYKWKELGDLFQGYEEVHFIYINGRRNLKYTRKLFFGGFIPIGVGVSILLLKKRSRRLVGLGRFILGGGILFEIGTLDLFIRSKMTLKKAVDTFNFEMIKKYGYKSDVSLVLGATRNGAGLVLQF